MYRYPNEDHNPYLAQYNHLCQTHGLTPNQLPRKLSKKAWKNLGLTLHHVLPISFYPELEDDPENMAYLSFEDHAMAHYYLWKGLETEEAAMAFWFIYLYGRKHRGFSIPDEDDHMLREDVGSYMRNRRR